MLEEEWWAIEWVRRALAGAMRAFGDWSDEMVGLSSTSSTKMVWTAVDAGSDWLCS